jgi:hypothetical protein
MPDTTDETRRARYKAGLRRGQEHRPAFTGTAPPASVRLDAGHVPPSAIAEAKKGGIA